MEQVRPDEELVARVAALDIGKAEVVVCIRVPGSRAGARAQEVCSFSTMTSSLLAMADLLRAHRVSRVVMEATSDYWKPPFYVLEAAGFDPWLVNASDVKHLPGRPKTDRIDAVWLAKLAERGMLRPSFVPPAEIRLLRDLTRFRTDLVRAASADKQRVEKLLEDAQIKLSTVASDIFGVSGRAMLSALISGERDPQVLAALARGRMRSKIPLLEEAFLGRFSDHHAFLLSTMLARIDATEADIAAVEARIEEVIAPFASARARLDEIPGIGATAAAAIIAEIGVDMSRFPTPGHLCSWARFAPRTQESAGRVKGRGGTGKGNPYLAAVLGEAVISLGRTETFLGARYRRIARRRGKKRALVAVGRSLLIVIWHLLNDPDASFNDLGAQHYDQRSGPARQIRNHVRQLEALGLKVTLEPAA